MTTVGKAASRFNELDLFRFTAALAVVLYHWAFRGAAANGLTSFSMPELVPVVKYGYLGVDLFFILSGFVILLSIQGKSPVEFAISRFTRLYPAFWTCCTLTFLVCLMVGGDRFRVTVPQFLTNLTMFNLYVGQPNIDGVYWTLTEEMKFYGFVFVLLCCRQSQRIETYLQAWLVVSLVCLQSGNRALIFLTSAHWSGHFIAGATYFLIHRSGLTARRILLMLAAATFSTSMAALNVEMMTAHYQVTYDRWTIVSLVASFHVLFFAVSQGWTQMSTRAFGLLGCLTYPLYLIHQNIGYLVLDQFANSRHRGLALIVVTAGSLIVAWAVYRLVEQNVNHRLKHWLENRLRGLSSNEASAPISVTPASSTAFTEMCHWLSDVENSHSGRRAA